MKGFSFKKPATNKHHLFCCGCFFQPSSKLLLINYILNHVFFSALPRKTQESVRFQRRSGGECSADRPAVCGGGAAAKGRGWTIFVPISVGFEDTEYMTFLSRFKTIEREKSGSHLKCQKFRWCISLGTNISWANS